MSAIESASVLDRWRKYVVKVIHTFDNATLSSFALENNEWRELQAGERYTIGLFGQAVWLVPAKKTLFRRCSFPADVLSKKDIGEAVQLEVSQWSPWQDKSGIYFIPTFLDDEWDVSIWVWDAESECKLYADLQSTGMEVTHVLPHDVWMSAVINAHASPALIIYQRDQQCRYQYVHAGQIIPLGWVKNEQEDRFCWKSMGLMAAKVEVIAVDESVDVSMLPWLSDAKVIRVATRWLPAALLERGRLPGGENWRDPMAWKSWLVGVSLLLLVWMAGSAFVIWNKQSVIHAELLEARQGGEDVLLARDTVDALSKKLLSIKRLKQQQDMPSLFLAQLIEYLPDDVWLYAMNLHRNTVELKGQGKYAATLAGLLSEMPMVESVNYMGDIRSIPRSEQESFVILLHLKAHVLGVQQ